MQRVEANLRFVGPGSPIGRRQWIQNPSSVGSNPTRGTCLNFKGSPKSPLFHSKGWAFRAFGLIRKPWRKIACMYDRATRTHALSLLTTGMSLNSVSKQTGIARATIRSWTVRAEPLPHIRPATCCRCADAPALPADQAAYVYLLGLYLGDGCLSPTRKGVYVLRIACADAWPGLIDACADAMGKVLPNNVWRTQCPGCVAVSSSSKHWRCFFPQHGPGRKHERSIVLEPWQRQLVDAHPWEFVRGLFHSDGCRFTNWTERTLASGERRRYEYTRYFFTNRSDDIRRLYSDTLDALGVEWGVLRHSGRELNISVARKPSVALMDAHVGPKY